LYYKNIYKVWKTEKTMTGKNKKKNYPYIYLIRVDKELKEKLKKAGSGRVREHLKRI